VILVSACLMGQPVRYDGRHSWSAEVQSLTQGQEVLALCPEVLGGLSTPRPPAHFVGVSFGREGQEVIAGSASLVDQQGRDLSQVFVKGAVAVARLAREHGVRLALLKDRSPSCGWDPMGNNPKGGPGQGVLSAALRAQDIEVREIRASARQLWS
jgi:uncharacterized protein YbbK (DUF523 family)